MIVVTILGMALLCLLFQSTRLIGLIALVLISILHPVILLGLLALAAALYWFIKPNNSSFLPKE